MTDPYLPPSSWARLRAVTEAADDVAAAKALLHQAIFEARREVPDEPRIPYRMIASAARLSTTTVRTLALTPPDYSDEDW